MENKFKLVTNPKVKRNCSSGDAVPTEEKNRLVYSIYDNENGTCMHPTVYYLIIMPTTVYIPYIPIKLSGVRESKINK
jgi:hypothetical protein